MGLSKESLARRLGVSATTVTRWEHGVIKPNQTMERAWDDALFTEVK